MAPYSVFWAWVQPAQRLVSVILVPGRLEVGESWNQASLGYIGKRERGEERSGVKSRLRVFSMEDCLEGFGPCHHGSQEVRSCVHLWNSFGMLLCIAGWPQTPSSPPVSAAWGSTAAPAPQVLDSRITHCWGDWCELAASLCSPGCIETRYWIFLSRMKRSTFSGLVLLFMEIFCGHKQ